MSVRGGNDNECSRPLFEVGDERSPASEGISGQSSRRISNIVKRPSIVRGSRNDAVIATTIRRETDPPLWSHILREARESALPRELDGSTAPKRCWERQKLCGPIAMARR